MSEQTQKTRPVIQAIQAVMSEVGSVEKRGKNPFHNYDYATAADILHKIQPLMAKAGLVIFQTQKSVTLGAGETILSIEYEFTLVHTSGDVWEERPIHTGMATARNTKGGFDDKAANKCHTAARKYFMLALFQIPTGDYADADADEGPAKAPAKVEPPKNKFTMLTDDGDEVGFATAGPYLKAIEDGFKTSVNPLGFWDGNSMEFQKWQTKAVKADHPSAPEFNRVGKLIVDSLQGKAA